MDDLDFTLPARPVSMQLVSGRGHYDAVIERVLEARVSVWIATANVKDLRVAARTPSERYPSVLDRMQELARRGVELRLLHARMPSRSFQETFDGLDRLVEGGLELRQCPRVHLKTVIVDGTWLYLGSANWTGAGLGVRSRHKRNFELGFVTDDELVLDEVQTLYQTLWTGRPCAACKLRDSCEAPLDL